MGLEEAFHVWPWKASDYVEYLRAIHGQPSQELRDPDKRLLRILQRCEKYVVNPRLFEWMPCEEQDIHERVGELLGCYYEDIQSKPRIVGRVKHFEPDSVIPSVDSIIEYKFVRSAADVKSTLDEILADINGYHQKKRMQLYFVVYETERFVREEDWQADVDRCNPAMPVRVVVLKGVRSSSEDEARRGENRARVPAVLRERRTLKRTPVRGRHATRIGKRLTK